MLQNVCKFNPKVSIVIPVYDGSNHLREALDSALSQTYSDYEVIVVNDGSDDGGKTAAIARSYGSRVRYIEKPNGGVASALNVGIRNMAGEYFSWLSHDDAYHPNKLEIQVDYLRKGDHGIILYSDYDFMNATSEFLKKRSITPPSDKGMRLALLTGDPVNGCTTLIPRACFTHVGLFDETLKSIQDYDMWFRLAKEYRFVHIPQALLKSRVHAAQGINTIRGHYDECTAFFIRAFSELSEKEISEMTGLPLTVFYARIAVSLKIRGFTEVAAHLLDLSKNNVAAAGLSTRLQRTALSAICNSLNKKFKPTYWIKRFRNGSQA